MKKLSFIKRSNGSHWVGDGFPVRNIFSYNDIADAMSPFLLMDYAGPTYFEPTTQRRGVGVHPHRGFETVTIVYAGGVSHRDSAGGGGTIGTGDVQWMTAAAGLLHEEFHSPEYARRGGPFEIVQLWVNLPAKDKRSAPAYQAITDAQIPRVTLPGHARSMRVIAGQYQDAKGTAHTFSPMNVWDLRLKTDRSLSETELERIGGYFDNNRHRMAYNEYLPLFVCIYMKLKILFTQQRRIELKDSSPSIILEIVSFLVAFGQALGKIVNVYI
jgi:quercetin 2,3-dioxygenase